ESTLAKPSGATWRAAAADFTIFEKSSTKSTLLKKPTLRTPHRQTRLLRLRCRRSRGHRTGRQGLLATPSAISSRCYHLGEPVVAYYNPALPASAPEPDAYHLELVPKRRANASLHFVFCPFGVLRVCPGDASEAMSLVEWHREAVLHSAMRQIPFCRLFRRMRVFRAWRAWTLRRRFESRRRTFGGQPAAAVPAYGRSMLQVATLLQQVERVKRAARQTKHQRSRFYNQAKSERGAGQRTLATARRQLGQLGSFIRYLDLFCRSPLSCDSPLINVAKFVDEVLLVGATASKTKSVKPNDAEDPVNADLSVNNDQLCTIPASTEFSASSFILATGSRTTRKLLPLHAFPMDGCITDCTPAPRCARLGPATDVLRHRSPAAGDIAEAAAASEAELRSVRGAARIRGQLRSSAQPPPQKTHAILTVEGTSHFRYQHYPEPVPKNAFDSANEDVNRFFEESNWLVAIHHLLQRLGALGQCAKVQRPNRRLASSLVAHAWSELTLSWATLPPLKCLALANEFFVAELVRPAATRLSNSEVTSANFAVYSSKLQQMVRMAYRPLTAEEEKLEEEAPKPALMAEARLIAKDLGENYCQVSPTPDKVVKEIVQKSATSRPWLNSSAKQKQAIVGENYPLTSSNCWWPSSDMRLELWKYFSVAVNFIADWKKQLFKKERHWRSLYVGFGSDFDPNREPRLVELLAFDLPAHGKLIKQPLAEYQLEKTLARLNKLWLDKELKNGGAVCHRWRQVTAGASLRREERAEFAQRGRSAAAAQLARTSQLRRWRSRSAVAN
uniref:Ras-GEF domain-containing protein n=1 Tax=Macrostomum lignano TaxID=282301 RepID=A0A1I8FPH5_9PLAT